MNRTANILVACLVGVLVAPRAAHSAPVQWTIDSSQSSFKLTIPDQKIILDGTSVTVRVRNQNSNTQWSTNVAALGGTFDTLYLEGQSIEFLASPPGSLLGLNSGSYRPDPAVFNPANTDFQNPHGRFENNSAAAAVIGGKVMGVPILLPVAPFDIAYWSLPELSFGLTSGVLPLAGTDFATHVGFALEGVAAIDGVTSLAGQPQPDTIEPILFGDSNSNFVGSIISPDPLNQPRLRQLTLPFQFADSLMMGTTPLNLTVSGTIVAYAMVPEPSSWLLALLGGASSLALVRRRQRRQG